MFHPIHITNALESLEYLNSPYSVQFIKVALESHSSDGNDQFGNPLFIKVKPSYSPISKA